MQSINSCSSSMFHFCILNCFHYKRVQTSCKIIDWEVSRIKVTPSQHPSPSVHVSPEHFLCIHKIYTYIHTITNIFCIFWLVIYHKYPSLWININQPLFLASVQHFIVWMNNVFKHMPLYLDVCVKLLPLIKIILP